MASESASGDKDAPERLAADLGGLPFQSDLCAERLNVADRR
jgi:hypothetical protein